MNVMLNADDQELVDGKVSSGQYPNPDAVVADAVGIGDELNLVLEGHQVRFGLRVGTGETRSLPADSQA